jgi:hypothetical protein
MAAAPAVAPPAVAAETIAIPTMNTNMTKLQSGLVDCPHCYGETVCKVTDNTSCPYCLTQSNLWTGGQIVVCSVCKGRGQITIAPNLMICPHCQGSTLCKYGTSSQGSCPNCIPFAFQDGHTYENPSYMSELAPPALIFERWINVPDKLTLVSGIDKAHTMCSLCKGIGQIAVSSNAQVCRHCSGNTVCQRGAGGTTSCQSCEIATRAKTKVPIKQPVRTMCSICSGRGYLTD